MFYIWISSLHNEVYVGTRKPANTANQQFDCVERAKERARLIAQANGLKVVYIM